MKKSIILVLNDIDAQLIKIHDLANLIERKSPSAVTSFRDWLLHTEEILKKNNLPEVSQLATIRAQLANFIPKTTKKRKEYNSYLASMLAQAQDDIWQLHQKFKTKAEKATDLINQLLTLIYQSGAFNHNENKNFTSLLENIWSFCVSHEQLKPITIQIMSTLKKSDILLIMAESIDLSEL